MVRSGVRAERSCVGASAVCDSFEAGAPASATPASMPSSFPTETTDRLPLQPPGPCLPHLYLARQQALALLGAALSYVNCIHMRHSGDPQINNSEQHTDRDKASSRNTPVRPLRDPKAVLFGKGIFLLIPKLLVSRLGNQKCKERFALLEVRARIDHPRRPLHPQGSSRPNRAPP
jgi:hypothetical protein